MDSPGWLRGRERPTSLLLTTSQCQPRRSQRWCCEDSFRNTWDGLNYGLIKVHPHRLPRRRQWWCYEDFKPAELLEAEVLGVLLHLCKVDVDEVPCFALLLPLLLLLLGHTEDEDDNWRKRRMSRSTWEDIWESPLELLTSPPTCLMGIISEPAEWQVWFWWFYGSQWIWSNPPRNPWKEPIQPIGHRVNLIPMVIVIFLNFLLFSLLLLFFCYCLFEFFFHGSLAKGHLESELEVTDSIYCCNGSETWIMWRLNFGQSWATLFALLTCVKFNWLCQLSFSFASSKAWVYIFSF